MKFLPKLALLIPKQCFLVVLGIVLALSINTAAKSTSLFFQSQSHPAIQQDPIQIAQNFLDLNFDSNYYQNLSAADSFYKQGNLVAVEKIQRKVKKDFPPAKKPPAPLVDISKLSPTAKKYWLTASQALEEEVDGDSTVATKIFNPLKNLTTTTPEFIPGHLLLVDAYLEYDKEEEALDAIEKASELYPDNKELLDKRIEVLDENGDNLEASIAAREFVSSHPEDKDKSKYQESADKYFDDYLDGVKTKVGISSGLGILGQVFTGQESNAVNLGSMLIQGESKTGQFLAEQYNSQYASKQMEYINNIGNKLAKLMGRDKFEYQFFVLDDPTPNAFALPGGKIFLHTGILKLMDSESELAGILGHELAHSVLSHSFQKIAAAASSNAIAQLVPGPDLVKGIAYNAYNSDFSRGKEKQADILGTRVLDAAGYSADGIYNVMAKLAQLEGESSSQNSLLATHPASKERMDYLEELIQTKGYNRYAYEGVQAYQNVFGSL
jgi:predicted Zn-dependent protease